jgi:hypothetical protein
MLRVAPTKLVVQVSMTLAVRYARRVFCLTKTVLSLRDENCVFWNVVAQSSRHRSPWLCYCVVGGFNHLAKSRILLASSCALSLGKPEFGSLVGYYTSLQSCGIHTGHCTFYVVAQPVCNLRCETGGDLEAKPRLGVQKRQGVRAQNARKRASPATVWSRFKLLGFVHAAARASHIVRSDTVVML